MSLDNIFSSIHSELVMFSALKKTDDRVDHPPKANKQKVLNFKISSLFVLSSYVLPTNGPYFMSADNVLLQIWFIPLSSCVRTD